MPRRSPLASKATQGTSARSSQRPLIPGRSGSNIPQRLRRMAALNITNELLRTKGRDETLETDVTDRLRSLRERVESALANGQQLEF